MNPHHMLISNSHQCSPPPAINLTVKSALQEWKSARTLLASTIQLYLAASTTLRVSCATPLRHSEEQSALEEALVTVDSELELLALEERALHDVRIGTLGTMRNNSTTLVRINTLPPEILARIFMLSKPRCVHDPGFKPDSFVAVCTYWRQVALDATGLWTHIDLGPNTPNGLPQLLLSRSGNTPIHVHVYNPRSHEEPDQDTSKRAVREVAIVLKPHLCRVRTFSLESESSNGFFVGFVMKFWITHGKFSSKLRSLSVHHLYHLHVLSLRSLPASDVLLDVNTLHLRNVVFNWDSIVYHGLVDLRLSFRFSVSISTSQLANLLSASPALTTLKLGLLRVDHVEDWIQPAPILMKHLEVLNLVGIGFESAALLLSLITLTSPLVELGMKFSEHDMSDNHLADSLIRSRVTTLYCSNYDNPPVFWKPLKCLPHLRTLVLDGFNVADIPEDDANPSPSRSLPLFHFPSVILLNCIVSPKRLNGFVAEHDVKGLHLDMCVTLTPGPSRGMQAIQTSLLGAYPNLRCSISDMDSTRQLACRTMFNPWD
ncbi:hypothetical protein FRC08_007102 [Ceratobasidium sp. 394]|nr:hypothetical protein FRC08_007102 [Ceratobasidium sp. 394]KAG9101930.1 hypothetical protein FS749_001461 [Ceratobasidium sp. UAMH 11750]